MNPDIIDWDEDLPPASPEEEYQALRRAIQRTNGFGLIFVQCAPAKGHEIIEQIKGDLPQKKVEVLSLKEPIRNLYQRVETLPNCDEIDVLFIEGLEYSIYEYEDAKRHLGWTTEEIQSYSWKGVPHILTNLNQQRERFRDNLKICFVFLVPLFVLKYLVYRAPDFFDWKSGLFKFTIKGDKVFDAYYGVCRRGISDFDDFNTSRRKEEIFKLQALLDEENLNCTDKFNLLRTQGFLFQSDENYLAAINNYTRALKLNVNHNVLHNQGISYLAINEYQKAAESITHAQQINSNCHTGWIDLGDIFWKMFRYEESISSYEKAINIKPNSYVAWFHKGISLGCLGRHKEEIESYDEALKINPKEYEPFYNQGVALIQLGQHQEAIYRFDNAIKYNSNHHSSWHRKADSLQKMGFYELAVESYNKAQSIEPKCASGWFSRGIVLFKLGSYEDALISFDNALEIKPDDSRYRLAKTRCLIALGSYIEAIQDLELLLSQNNNRLAASIQLQIAKIFLEKDSNSSAIDDFERLCALPQILHIVQKNYGEVEQIFNIEPHLGWIEQLADAFGANARDVESQLQDYLDNPESQIIDLKCIRLVAYAEKKLEQENFEEALALLDQALQVNPSYHPVLYCKAYTYALQKQVEPALANLRQAIKFNPEEYRELAKTDSDFANIRDDPRFQALIS